MSKRKSRSVSKSARTAGRGRVETLVSAAATDLRRRGRSSSRALKKGLRAAGEYPVGRYAAIGGALLAVGGIVAAAYTILSENPEMREKLVARLRGLKSMVPLLTSATTDATEAAAPLH